MPVPGDRNRILCWRKLPKEKDEQVRITVGTMVSLTQSESWKEAVHWAAHQAGYGTMDARERAVAFCSFVKQHVGFRLDPPQLEYIRLPSALAADIRSHRPVVGDCDDMTLLLGTMLYSQGYPVGYITMSTEPGSRELRHVFVATSVAGRLLYCDPSVARPYATGGKRLVSFWVPTYLTPPA